MKTNFSFEVRYAVAPTGEPASTVTPGRRDEVMQSLQTLLQDAFGALDPAARVQVIDSQRGTNRKIVELVTTLQDEQIATTLEAFCNTHGVVVTALE